VTALPLIEVPAAPGVRAVFTTRAGGVGAPPFDGLNLSDVVGDDPEAVRANRRLLCATLGVDGDRVAMLRQVHGADVRTVGDDDDDGPFTTDLGPWREGDGLTTRAPGRALLVMGADCLPVLLWRRDGTAVAAAHAGWRGLVGGVLEAAARTLGDPGEVGAAVGPGVGACCYPVSADVRRAFAERFGSAALRGDAVDLAAAARAALVGHGVPEAQVAVVGRCTACAPAEFFSFRRDGAAAGRQAGVVWIAGRP